MENIYNFLKLNDNLFSSGMPTPEQIPSIAENGVQVVINLATSKSEGWIPNEKELMEEQNITYYNIPVDWDNPTIRRTGRVHGYHGEAPSPKNTCSLSGKLPRHGLYRTVSIQLPGLVRRKRLQRSAKNMEPCRLSSLAKIYRKKSEDTVLSLS